MHAIAELSTPAAPRSLMDTREARAAKRQILAQAQRFQARQGSYRCRCCGKRCEVQVTYDAIGLIAHSKGQCRTPDCLAWEE